MKVSDALASAFVKEGVTTVFGLMGNGNMYWWYALDQHPDVAIHETRHEGTALTMAEGWARATGQPGICTVTQGPGLSQLATALIVAARAKVPMVVFAGDTALNDPDGVQQFDQHDGAIDGRHVHREFDVHDHYDLEQHSVSAEHHRAPGDAGHVRQ